MRPFAATRVWTRIGEELTSKVNETLVPKLSKPRLRRLLPDRGQGGVFSHSVSLRQPSRERVSNVLATWIRDEKLETLIPNAPKITSGEVVAHSNASRARSSSSDHRLSRAETAIGGKTPSCSSPHDQRQE